jgi:hypothetical protein
MVPEMWTERLVEALVAVRLNRTPPKEFTTVFRLELLVPLASYPPKITLFGLAGPMKVSANPPVVAETE